MTHETHSICNKRLKQKVDQQCCFCSPHSHCEFKKEQVSAPNLTRLDPNIPWDDQCLCEEYLQNKTCSHSKKDLCGRLIHTRLYGGMTCAMERPCPTHDNKKCEHGNKGYCLACYNNSIAVEPQNWEKEFSDTFETGAGYIMKYLKANLIKDFIRNLLKVEKEKSFEEGRNYAAKLVLDKLNETNI